MADENEWYRCPTQCQEMIDLHGSASAAARAWGIPERRVRYWAQRHQYAEPAPHSESGPAAASATISADRASILAPPSRLGSMTPEELLEQHGLNPAEWSYQATVNSWEALAGNGDVQVLHQLKVSAVKRPEALLGFGLEPGWTPAPARRSRKAPGAVRTIAVFADPHFPLHEPDLIEGSVAWLEDHRPDEIVLLGDNSDANPFKRHSKNPRTETSVSDHQRSTYEGLARWRNAAPDARMRWIRGNHDAWMIERIRELMPHYEEIRAHPTSSEPMLGLRQLFALDELRIELVGDETGHYHDDTVEIAPGLVALHGVKAGRDGAVKEQAGWEGTSLIQGHCHKWQITGVTKRLAGGGSTQRFAINAPAMSVRDLGYAPAHDVAQGFMVITLHDDGEWIPEMAIYNPQTGSTMFRDWRYG